MTEIVGIGAASAGAAWIDPPSSGAATVAAIIVTRTVVTRTSEVFRGVLIVKDNIKNMTLVDGLFVVLGVLALGGLVGLLAIGAAVALARRPDRAPVSTIAAADLDDYFARRAAFAVTVSARTPLAPAEIFRRLARRPYLSSLPFLSGPEWLDNDWPDKGMADLRGARSRRTMSGTIYAVSEQVIRYEPDVVIALTGTAVCTPATIASFAERFTIGATERDGVTEVRWTIAGTPRWVGWLPWRWGAPLSRPLFAFVLRHVLRLGAFRAPRPAGNED
ncbi:hypothetical protein GCM10010528_28100 [Gordonia defluvii]|uniref:Polyketide cyclase / dehydrase and lipid transport n=2 Tax=Gordoniaceae TaxID=85026 RepID=A0ABP6LK63_9ACTN